jgi:hypothetical protein
MDSSRIGTAILALTACACALAGRARAAQGDVLRSWAPPGPASTYGVEILPDVSGDGVPEILIGDPTRDEDGVEDVGALLVFSGEATGAGQEPRLLRAHLGGERREWFGRLFAALGDMDGDGWHDYAGSSGGYDPDVPRVRVFSGRDGRLLFAADEEAGVLLDLGDVNGDGLDDALLGTGVRAGGSFALLYRVQQPGEDIAPMAVSLRADVDGDGAPDFVYNLLNFSYTRSTTYVLSGRSGAVLNSHYVLGSGATHSLAAPGDVDGDGDPDFAEACYLAAAPLDPRVRYRDATTGAYLGFPRIPDEHSVTCLALAGDLDESGRPELFVRASYGGQVLAIDTASNRVLWELERTGFLSLAGGHDWNGDGFQDFLVRHVPSIGGGPGSLEVRSGAPARAATADEPRTGIRALGSPCARAGAREPRIGTSGLPLLGERLRVNVSGLEPLQPVLVVAGTAGARRSSAGECAPLVAGTGLACTSAEVAPGAWVASAELPLPAEPALAGSILHVQALVPGARSAAATRVLECQLGIGEDAPTEIAGTVELADGTPVAGASVGVFGQDVSAITGSDGWFVLPGVAVRPWPLGLQAFVEVGGIPMSGALEDLEPDPGRTTQATIVLRRGLLIFVRGDGMTDGSGLMRSVLGQDGERVVVHRELPRMLAPYRMIWNVPLRGLSALEEELLLGFARRGRSLHGALDGYVYSFQELSPYPALDTWLSALVGASATWELVPGPVCFNAGALEDAALVPSDLTGSCTGDYPHERGVLQGVAGANALARGGDGSVVGALWTELRGVRGRIAVTSTREQDVRLLDNLRYFLTH